MLNRGHGKRYLLCETPLEYESVFFNHVVFTASRKAHDGVVDRQFPLLGNGNNLNFGLPRFGRTEYV